MPQIKSAKKRVLVAERNRQRNTAVKSEIKTAVKSVVTALTDKKDEATVFEALKLAYSLIDKAVLKGVLHKSTAARQKSRLTKMVNKAKVA